MTITKTATAKGETWVRRFGDRSYRSYLAATPAGMTERFGPLIFLLVLTIQN